MRVVFGLLAGLLFAPAAHAQVSPVPPIVGGVLDLGTGTAFNAGVINLHGVPALVVSTTGNGSMFVGGAGPGASVDESGSSFLSCAGPGACGSAPPNLTLELSAYGTGSSRYVTGGSGYSVTIGTSSNGTDLNASHLLAVGGDSHRNSVNSSFTVALGDNSSRNGTSDNDVVIGSAARPGCSLCIEFSGGPVANSTLTLTVLTTNTSVTRPTTGLPVSVTYTVPSGGASLATAVAALWSSLNAILSGNTVFYGFSPVSIEAMDSNAPTIISLDFPGTSATAAMVNATLVDTASAVTIATDFTWTNQDILIGDGVAASSALHGQNNFSVIIGAVAGQHAVSFGTGVAVGDQTVQMLNGDVQFDIGGFKAGQNMTGTYNNTLHGYSAGSGITTGKNNDIYGAEDQELGNCITTGSGNSELGYGSCVQNPTANGQMSIRNIIYGLNLNGFYTGKDTSGSLGIGQPAPGARLDILGTGTGAELVFRATASNGTNVMSVADNGTLTVGTTPGVSCAGAPTSSYATINGIVTHC